MKRFLVLLALVFVLFFGVADHAHFDAEKVKPGVEFYREWRNQAEIDSDWWTYGNSIPPGTTHAAWYDPVLDGALYPIRNVGGSDVSLGTLEPFYREGGQGSVTSSDGIWVQWEIIIDQDFYDNIITQSNFDSMKLARFYQSKGQCGTEDRFMTWSWKGSAGHEVEMAVSSSCYGWPDQGIDSGYVIPGDTWTRMTTHFDVDGKVMKMFVTDISTGQTSEVFSYPTDFPSTFIVGSFKAQLQSTSRNHNPGTIPYDYFLGYRNLIVSSQPIAFDSSTPCSGEAECSDGNPCNGIETCSGSVCQSGTPVVVDDGVSCTIDSCDPSTGAVSNVPYNSLCVDSNGCTTNEVCTLSGCSFDYATGSCDDGNACTSGDVCSLGSCSGSLITSCVNNDGCCPLGCDSSSDSDCGAVTSSSLVVDFDDPHVFGWTGWENVLLDTYTRYFDKGPGGVAGSSNPGYNYQGVSGSPSRVFSEGDQIVVTWYNDDASVRTFTPQISFEDSDRRVSGVGGTWYLMSEVSVPSGEIATSEFAFDSSTEGSYDLININSDNSNDDYEIVCDKIEFVGSGGGSPTDCSINGGTCKTNSCLSYNDCSDFSFSCSSGNCCVGTCTDIVGSGDYYVSNFGSDYAAGTISEPLRTIGEALSRASNGDEVVVRAGTYNELVSFPTSGVTLKTMNGEVVILSRSGTVVSINQPDISIEGFVVDGNFGAGDAVEIGDNSHNLVFRNMEVKNSARDCVDVGSPGGVLIEDSEIHDCLYYSGGRVDAHGIVTTGVIDFTVRNTEIYYVSGDALQFQYDGWNNVRIEDSVLWNGPLPSARAGFQSGDNPGEDGVDTKYCENGGRGRLYLENVTAYGWDGDYVSNGAAFNLKQNIDADLDGVTCFDSEICLRARGPGSNLPDSNCGNTPRGGAWITMKNAVMYDSLVGVRYEDSIDNLHIYNNIFGDNLIYDFQSAGGYNAGFDVRNNLFFGLKPGEASDSSNLGVSSGDFVDSSNGDYHPVENSDSVDAGVTIAEVSIDRDGNLRSGAYDVGAYEYGASQFHEADLDTSGKIDFAEVNAYIGLWLSGSRSISDLLAVINLWRWG